MRRRVAAALLVAGTTSLVACSGEHPPIPVPSTSPTGDWEGTWTVRFSRSYPPENPPPATPPVSPAEAIVTLSFEVADGRVRALYTKTDDTSGKTWGDTAARPNATEITTRVWSTCDSERRPFPASSAQALVEDVVGELDIPADAVTTTTGTREWMRREGVTEARIIQTGNRWSDRRIQHYRPEQNKLDLADSTYQRICG